MLRSAIFAVTLLLTTVPLTSALVDLADRAPQCGILQDDGGSGRDVSVEAPLAIAPGQHGGCVDGVDRVDAFTFPVLAGQRVRLTGATTDCAEIRMGLWTNDGTGYHGFASLPEDECLDGSVLHVAPRDGTWYVDVRYAAGAGDYVFDLLVGDAAAVPTACEPAQDDAGSGRDAAPGHTVSIGPGTYHGCVDAIDTRDPFTLAFAAGDRLRATLRVPAEGCTDFALALRPASGPPVDHDWAPFNGGCRDYVVGATATSAGTLDVRVDSLGQEAPYVLVVERGPHLASACGAGNDAGAGRDASAASPVAVAEGTHAGCVDVFDQEDAYVFTPPVAPFALRATPDPACASLRVIVEAPSGASREDQSFRCGAVDMAFTPGEAGPHKVRVLLAGGEARYTLAIGGCVGALGLARAGTACP